MAGLVPAIHVFETWDAFRDVLSSLPCSPRIRRSSVGKDLSSGVVMLGARTVALLFAFLALVAVAGLLVVSLSKPNTQRHQESHQAQPAKQNDTAEPPAHGDTQNQAECGASENKHRNYWERFVCYVEARNKFFTAFGTLIIAAFTVCLAFATVFLYTATRNLVEGADETAEKQLRAYVFIKDGGIAITPDGVGFVFGVIYKNFGKTPAYQYSTWTGGGIYPVDDLPFPKEPKSLTERVNRSIVGPSAETPVVADSVALSPPDLQAIRNRTKAIFIWGGVDYVDAFDKPRHFIFKMRMTGPESQIQPATRGWALTPHPLGYEAN
jgi:hypothetical protein